MASLNMPEGVGQQTRHIIAEPTKHPQTVTLVMADLRNT